MGLKINKKLSACTRLSGSHCSKTAFQEELPVTTLDAKKYTYPILAKLIHSMHKSGKFLPCKNNSLNRPRRRQKSSGWTKMARQ
jgi:hypothetical protein